MKVKSLCAALVMVAAFLAVASAKARENKDEAAKPAATSQSMQHDQDMRFEGEKRFHSNCSRCHAAPPKFPPRMMGTIVRHMRVRAMLTDDDMRYILRYMTQ
jgi:cytochrome c5